MATAQKQAIIVGGPNGAGKSTLVHRHLQSGGFKYLCADIIASQLAPANPESVATEAGREFLKQLTDDIAAGTPLIIETTLAGRSFQNYMKQLCDEGYHVRLVFIFLKSADSHVARVAERVRKGGHHVPEDDVRRRYQRSLRNFWSTYRNLADDWQLFYNSGTEPIEIAFGDASGFLVTDQENFDRFLSVLHA